MKVVIAMIMMMVTPIMAMTIDWITGEHRLSNTQIYTHMWVYRRELLIAPASRRNC